MSAPKRPYVQASRVSKFRDQDVRPLFHVTSSPDTAMNAHLTTRLRTLRLSGLIEALPARVAQADAASLAHLEFLELLVEDELTRRADRLFARRLTQAGIVAIKTLAEFDWSFNPKLPKAKLAELASDGPARRPPVASAQQ